jgi:hypothetical protein
MAALRSPRRHSRLYDVLETVEPRAASGLARHIALLLACGGYSPGEQKKDLGLCILPNTRAFLNSF